MSIPLIIVSFPPFLLLFVTVFVSFFLTDLEVLGVLKLSPVFIFLFGALLEVFVSYLRQLCSNFLFSSLKLTKMAFSVLKFR